MPSLEDLVEEMAGLRARLEAAEGVLAIHALKARYGELVDRRFEKGRPLEGSRLDDLAKAIADLFTPDGIWDGGPALGVAVGRAAIADRMRRTTLAFSRHLFLQPRITVTGDTAEARWELLSPCTTAGGKACWMSGFEDDEYVRDPQGYWLHHRMRLTTVFMAPAGEGWGPIHW